MPRLFKNHKNLSICKYYKKWQKCMGIEPKQKIITVWNNCKYDFTIKAWQRVGNESFMVMICTDPASWTTHPYQAYICLRFHILQFTYHHKTAQRAKALFNQTIGMSWITCVSIKISVVKAFLRYRISVLSIVQSATRQDSRNKVNEVRILGWLLSR